MDPWATWKSAFDAWEQSTAKWTEQVLASPLVLEPSGAMLSAVMRARAAADKRAATWWGAVGLPTRHDQERMMHALNQLQSRIMDLEEQIAVRDELLAAQTKTVQTKTAQTKTAQTKTVK